ncbi:MAG: hypothetical protein ABIK65_00865 [Candidatus Eisenbacteria bacterium]
MTATETRISTNKLLIEIRRTEQYLSTRFHTSPCSIALLGGEEGLVEFLRRETGLSVRAVSLPGDVPESGTDPFLLALGAALRALDPESPGVLRQKGGGAPDRRPSGGVPLGLIPRVAAIALPLVAVAFLGAHLGLRAAEKGNDRLEEELDRVVRQSADPAEEHRLDRWERRALALNRYRSFQYRWSEALWGLALSIPPRVALREMSAAGPSEERFEGLYGESSEGGDESLDWLLEDHGEEGEGAVLSLRGRAPSLAEVRLFLNDLEERTEFRDVRLASAGLSEEEGAAEGELDFEIRCVPVVERSRLGREETR